MSGPPPTSLACGVTGTAPTNAGGEEAEGVLEQGGRGGGRPEAQVQLHDVIGCKFLVVVIVVVVAADAAVVVEMVVMGL